MAEMAQATIEINEVEHDGEGTIISISCGWKRGRNRNLNEPDMVQVLAMMLLKCAQKIMDDGLLGECVKVNTNIH